MEINFGLFVFIYVQVSAEKSINELWPDICRLERFHLVHFPLIVKNNQSMHKCSLQLPSKPCILLNWEEDLCFNMRQGESQDLCHPLIQFLYFTDDITKAENSRTTAQSWMVKLGLAEALNCLIQNVLVYCQFQNCFVFRRKKWQGLGKVEFHHMTLAILGNENFWQFSTLRLRINQWTCLFTIWNELPALLSVLVQEYKTYRHSCLIQSLLPMRHFWFLVKQHTGSQISFDKSPCLNSLEIALAESLAKKTGNESETSMKFNMVS